jgi:hypothetical protein
MTTADMLREMLATENMPKRIDGGPESPEDRMAAYEALHRLAADTDKIRIICIACSNDVPLLQSAACACGGFVCPDCQRIEEDGVCDHLPPGIEEQDED